MAWRLAWRGLYRNRRRTFVVLAAVTVGIAGCSLAIATNSGMAVQMVKTAIATELGHVQIHAPGFDAEPQLRLLLEDGGAVAAQAVEGRAEVRAWALRVRGQGLMNSPRASVGIRVVAIQPDAEAQISSFASSMTDGEWFGSQSSRVVIGNGVARRLRADPGDKVVLSVQDLAGDLTGQAFRIGGVFRTSSKAVNDTTVLVRLDEAQRLFGLAGGVSELILVAEDFQAVDSLAEVLAVSLGETAEVRSWKQLQPLLVYMVDAMDQMAWVMYAGVFIAMGFGIANVLLMSISERTREIGVMMAMGMKPRRVVLSIVLESMIVTGLGLALGLALGFFCVWLLQGGIDLSLWADGLENLGVGAVIVPVIRLNDVVAPVVLASVAALLASTWPAVRAAGLRPGEALRRV
jgi:ABC-type lipoprotein release transport system permease subunit